MKGAQSSTRKPSADPEHASSRFRTSEVTPHNILLLPGQCVIRTGVGSPGSTGKLSLYYIRVRGRYIYGKG